MYNIPIDVSTKEGSGSIPQKEYYLANNLYFKFFFRMRQGINNKQNGHNLSFIQLFDISFIIPQSLCKSLFSIKFMPVMMQPSAPQPHLCHLLTVKHFLSQMKPLYLIHCL